MTPHEPPPMSDALRALVEADAQRPGPPDNVRTGVYAALGVSLGVIPAGVVVATNAAAATTTAAASATAGTATAGTTAAATAAGAAGPVALLAKVPLVGVGLGAVLGASLTAYVVKGPPSHARRAPAAAVVDHGFQ